MVKKQLTKTSEIKDDEPKRIAFKGIIKKPMKKQESVNSRQLKMIKNETKNQLQKIKKSPMEMSLIEIINDRKSGLIAPSEIKRRKKQLEARKSGLNSETKSKIEN